MPATSQTSSTRQNSSSNTGSTTAHKKTTSGSSKKATTASFIAGAPRTTSPKPIDPNAKAQDPPQRREQRRHPDHPKK
ncbi:hypothetical protein BHYA_0223g00060 [Botrytis hyacinthi]|uniref:Uncharacterized protein n=1 Tax=Botrytis hyacinthi TaxID=278943 RepID=A0A4Z1GA60_9HELO|nr:hypothetical protein BHYA_0223g00060 [Botrytis hyacinthi]